MDIFLNQQTIRQIRTSAQDAIEEGDTDTLREDIIDAFNEEEIAEIERRIETGDFYEFLSNLLEEWAGDEVDELFELLEAHLSDAEIEVKYSDPELEDDESDDDDDGEDDSIISYTDAEL